MPAKNKTFSCLYCGAEADSIEHVPPRSFLEKPFPANLTTVRACFKCNQGFSKDEEYVVALLAQIGTNDSLQAKVNPGGKIDRAFSRSPAFEQRFLDRLKVNDKGQVFIEPESERVQRVLLKVVCGLYWLQYKHLARTSSLGPIGFWPFNIEDGRPVQAFMPTFTEHFKSKQWMVIQKDVFEFMFARLLNNKLCCIINWYDTLWITCIVPHPQSCLTHVGQFEIPL